MSAHFQPKPRVTNIYVLRTYVSEVGSTVGECCLKLFRFLRLGWQAATRHNFYNLAPGFPGNQGFSRNQGEDPNKIIDILYGQWGHPSGNHRNPAVEHRGLQDCVKTALGPEAGSKKLDALKVRCRMDNTRTTKDPDETPCASQPANVPKARRRMSRRGGAPHTPTKTPQLGEKQGA
jgi:hypothetical protein